MKRGSEYYPISKSSSSFMTTTLSVIKSVVAFASVTQCLHSTEKKSGFVNIPLDLVVEILKKLPAKSLVRFRCVSKQWSSIISSRRDFLDSIVTRSLTQPQRTHFIFHHYSAYKSFFIFTSTYQNIADNESIFIPTFTRSVRYDYVRGLILCWLESGNSIAIYNPTTRQALWSPEKTPTTRSYAYFFGYDPIKNEYKVLGKPTEGINRFCQVFTLTVPPAANQWRYIYCLEIERHYPIVSAICINGTIYHQALTEPYLSSTYSLFSFDVSSEKFDKVKAPKTLLNNCLPLINYHGKLGFICCQNGVEIWVMEHSEKLQEWSKIFFNEQMVYFNNWFCGGVTRAAEMVFVDNRTQHQNHNALRVSYYDPKRNSVRYEDIECITRKRYLKHKDVFLKTIVTDHVENTMSLY